LTTYKTIKSKENRLKILFQDIHYIAIDKPAGLLVHRSPLDSNATEFAVQTLRDQIGQAVNPCHRLDRPTSGILLFALSTEATRAAQHAFISHRVRKTYHAVVRGWLQGSGKINYDLRNEENPNKVQPAETEYNCLKQSTVAVPVGRYPTARCSLVELHPKTGRTHQLRRHMAHLRHPILGDTRHGDGAQNQFLRKLCGQQILLLRAVRLSFRHPINGEMLDIYAGANQSFDTALDRLGLGPND
jgi:tRNA pseudouridine65 synthase